MQVYFPTKKKSSLLGYEAITVRLLAAGGRFHDIVAHEAKYFINLHTGCCDALNHCNGERQISAINFDELKGSEHETLLTLRAM